MFNSDDSPMLKKAETHSLAEHGDVRIHPECAECRKFSRALLAEEGRTPEWFVERYGHLRDMVPAIDAMIQVIEYDQNKTSLWDL